MQQSKRNSQRVWISSELYYPELTSTGYFLTGIAEGLAEEFSVSVLCAQPSYWARGMRAPTQETRNGVDIKRCWSTTLNKNRLFYKLINLATICISIFFSALVKVERGDVLICVTNPPLLPYFAAVACWLKGARFVLLIHDVYPEVLTRLGFLARESILIRIFDQLSRWLYKGADRIVVVGRDMHSLISAKLTSGHDRVVIATNWANTELISAQSRDENKLLSMLNLNSRFVVQFWGNMGRPHCIEDLVDAAEMLAADKEIHFLLIGWGTRTTWAIAEKQKRGLENLTIMDPLPREESCDVQNACDIVINTLHKGMAGVSVPSRTYNAMAAGKPVLAVCEDDSELAFMVREEEVGWVIPPGRPDLIAAAIKEAKANHDRLLRMGERARNAVKTKYTQGYVVEVYRNIVEGLRAQ